MRAGRCGFPPVHPYLGAMTAAAPVSDLPLDAPFDADTLARIAAVLGVPASTPSADVVRFALTGDERSLSVEIRLRFDAAPSMAGGTRNVVTVLGRESLVQLHGVSGVVTSEELGEVMFLSRQGATLSGLVVERSVGCSLYAHVDERLLSADFMALPPELAMASVSLSLAETFLDDAV